MTGRSINEWLDIDVDIAFTLPLGDHDIIRSIQNKEDKSEIDSDDETNEPADEPR